MMKLSRGAMVAIAAAVAIPAGVAIAKTVEHIRWHNMSPETRARLDEGKLAMAKTALKLNAEQEKLWTPVESEIRAAFKVRADRRAEWDKKREDFEKLRSEGKEPVRPDMAERVEKMSQRMSELAERMKGFAGAFKPFYASLTEEQKDVLRPLMHQLMPGRGGHHGFGGSRWAFGGGWGERGGWGHHGGWRHHEGRGGPMMEDRGGGGAGGDDRGPRAPQNLPEVPGVEDNSAPSDNL